MRPHGRRLPDGFFDLFASLGLEQLSESGVGEPDIYTDGVWFEERVVGVICFGKRKFVRDKSKVGRRSNRRTFIFGSPAKNERI